jgi:hypothetical protein
MLTKKLGPGLLVYREPCGVFLAVDACEMFKRCEYLSALVGSILKDEVLHLEPKLSARVIRQFGTRSSVDRAPIF